GRSAVAGRGTLELVCRRDGSTKPAPIRERFDPRDKALAEYQPVYEQSLDRCFGRWGLELPGGDFATEVIVPEQAHGPCHLRLSVSNHTAHALGATNILVKQAAVETAGVGASAHR